MYYFLLQKLSPLTQRWRLVEVALDPTYDYLYYSAPIAQADIDHYAQYRESGGGDEETMLLSSSGVQVRWRHKLKLTALHYAADDYAVPASSQEFKESILLTLTVEGLERPLPSPRTRHRDAAVTLGSSATTSISTGRRRRTPSATTRSTNETSLQFGPSRSHSDSPACPDALQHCDDDDNDDKDAARSCRATAPEYPSQRLDVHTIQLSADGPAVDLEDEDENVFRVNDLAPSSSDAAAETTASAETSSTASSVMDSPVQESESPPSGRQSLAQRFTFGLLGRSRSTSRTLTLRALHYEAFRMVSLRLRQTLVRHGYCAPLHAGLPLYDPRNGIALATVPLHLRHAFHRLNEVVFYSLQCGHTVYVRHYREVRGFYGYLCITHDTLLLLQEDGRCPRWLDLEDVTGVDYVLHEKSSFVAIRAAAPCADFVFLPVFPSYPYCVDFDAAETVEGIVSMLRRLLMQRLRMHEAVSLPVHDVADAEDTSDFDQLCHITDLSAAYADVFRYIAARGPDSFMLSRGMTGKTPQHFTYKRDLAAALRREDDDDAANTPPASHEVVLRHVDDTPSRPTRVTRGDGLAALHELSQASFTTTTVSHLLAPPSHAAERRARDKLRPTRTDPQLRRQPPSTTTMVSTRRGSVENRVAALHVDPTLCPARTATTATPSVTDDGIESARRGVSRGTAASLLPERQGVTQTDSPTAPRTTSAAGTVSSTRVRHTSYGLVPATSGTTVAPHEHTTLLARDAAVVAVPASKGVRLPLQLPSPQESTANAQADPCAVVDAAATSSEEDEDDSFDSEDVNDLLATAH